MSDNPLPWFRFYKEAKSDIKLARVARDCGVSRMEATGAWALLLCAAADSPVRGKLYVTLQERFNETDITDLFCCDETTAQSLLDAFCKMSMIHFEDGVICVTNWDKRQYESDTSTERVRKHRTMKRYGNVSETASDTDTDTDINTREGEPGSESQPDPQKPDEFSAMAATVEILTGYTQTGDDVGAIQEMVKLKITEEDIRGALDFFKSKNKTARGAASILESAKYQRAKRIQAANARSPARTNGNGHHAPAAQAPPGMDPYTWECLEYLRKNRKGTNRKVALEEVHKHGLMLEVTE